MKYHWLLVIGLLIIFSRPAAAAEDISLTISPLFFNYHLDVGQTEDLKVLVGNTGDQPLTVQLESLDYNPALEEEGVANFGPAPATVSLRSWLVGPAEPLVILPHLAQLLSVKLTVPPGAAVGSHYGVLAARTIASSSAAVNISGRVGAIVLVNVGGPLDFSTTVQSVKTSGVSGPLSVQATVKHQGNAHYRTGGLITVTAWPGGQLVTSSLPEQILVPGVTRTLKTTLSAVPSFGLFYLTAKITDGQGQLHEGATWLWRSPRWLNITALLAAALLVGLFLRRRHAL